MKILVAEDDATCAKRLEATLTKEGYRVVWGRDGVEAHERILRERFDAVIVDWMMPRMDGIQLIRAIRTGVTPAPLILMLTALASKEGREHALKSGADDFLAKPWLPSDVLQRLRLGLSRMNQVAPVAAPPVFAPVGGPLPASVMVCVAASTGGPEALRTFLSGLPSNLPAQVIVVQHGPKWMLETFAEQLGRHASLPVALAEHGARPKTGTVLVAPGERHLVIGGTGSIELLDTEPVNFVRPAADVLFRSVAASQGRFAIAVVLTGLGRDGAMGAAAVAAAAGVVLVQDPSTCVAPSMPSTILDSGIAQAAHPVDELTRVVVRKVTGLAAALDQARAGRRGGPPLASPGV
jgi:two-component system chemotaxis response regulator CheB